MYSLLLSLLTLLALDGSRPADDSSWIDEPIDQRLREAGVSPAPVVDDYVFLRRVTLDLAGRIPTTAELREWERERLDRPAVVDRLLNSSDFDFHLRNELDLLLLARRKNDKEWREFLWQACRDRLPWDVVFRDMILPERHRPGDKGPATFLRERVRDLDILTNDTSSLLLGINISCAKCHDHPLVADWEQRHYFGMASFFKRTFATKAGSVAERMDGKLKFTTVDGEEHEARFLFLTGDAVDEPAHELSDDQRKLLVEQLKKLEKDAGAPAVDQLPFSPRDEFVRLALADDRHLLARNMVNRTWARLFGRGLVDPLDQMHSDNPASHPEVLDNLTDEFVRHEYDLRWLIRTMVLTRAYARGGRWSGEPPLDELFAVSRPRALTPRQLALALIIATGNPNQVPAAADLQDWDQQRAAWEKQADRFAAKLQVPGEGFQVGSDEALLFSNNPEFEQEYLRDASDRLLGYLQPIESVDARAQAAFLAVLGRPAEAKELASVKDYLASRADRQVAAWQQIVWALLASPEFRFNH